MKEYLIFVLILLTLLACLVLANISEVGWSVKRYDFFQSTEAYQDGIRSEMLQMMSEYEAITDCKQRNALANLLRQKNNELRQPLNLEGYTVKQCEQ